MEDCLKSDLRSRIELLLGEFNPENHIIQRPRFELIDSFEKDNVSYRRILIPVDSKDKLTAYILSNSDIEGRSPGILALHQTTEVNSVGAKEVAGLEGNINYHYGIELAKLGFTVIAPDYPFFGDYDIELKDIYDNYGYESITMKGVMNHISCLNVLESLDGVDPEKIGCIGHSLGGTNTIFITFFDKRIKVAVISAGFTTFKAYAERSKSKDLSKWAQPDKYMPKTSSVFNNSPDEMPFDFPELLKALSPTPLFLSTPIDDEIFEHQGALECIEFAKKAYPNRNLVHRSPKTNHDFPSEFRKDSYEFLINKLSI